ncbi:hypothetical protein TDB9533_04031 [Thalassocella blandensis]|nr:hypothetical protein TDB9533_04031 [Thalassocella blandensis]
MSRLAGISLLQDVPGRLTGICSNEDVKPCFEQCHKPREGIILIGFSTKIKVLFTSLR